MTSDGWSASCTARACVCVCVPGDSVHASDGNDLKRSSHDGTYLSQNKEILSVEEALFVSFFRTVEAQMEMGKRLKSLWMFTFGVAACEWRPAQTTPFLRLQEPSFLPFALIENSKWFWFSWTSWTVVNYFVFFNHFGRWNLHVSVNHRVFSSYFLFSLQRHSCHLTVCWQLKFLTSPLITPRRENGLAELITFKWWLCNKNAKSNCLLLLILF